ncbi:MAG: hypothetical protein ACFFG0_46185 [Candidatus Thorarchaeota archaeon]
MVYDADTNKWFCVECYERIKENITPKDWFNEGIIVNNKFGKPCHELGWCPYGSLGDDFRPYDFNNNEIICKIFSRSCPVFYHAEHISE